MRVFFVLSLCVGTAFAQDPVSEAGPHHRVVKSITEVLGLDGQRVSVTNSYIHLEPGLNRLERGQWVESEEALEIIGDTVVARKTAQQVIWAANANSAGAVDVAWPDGQRLRGHCLGLGYFDAATGNNVMIAELKDSVAEVVQPNVVIYRDAFDDVDGDLVYVNRRGSFEQLVVLHAKPPGPADFGLDPASTRLEVISEFLDPPVPRKATRVLRQETDALLRVAMVEPDLVDEELDFGSVRMPEGKAFLPAGAPWRMEAASSIPVSKRWTVTPEGRTVLFEAVEYGSLEPLLGNLNGQADGRRIAERRKAGKARVLPTRQVASTAARPIQVAVNEVSSWGRAVTIDYTTISSGLSNYRFKGDETYYINGTISCGGTNTIFEAGTVLKYALNSRLDLASDNLTWQGTAYRPVVLTACDDTSVGQTVSTGSLSGYYATTALNILSPLTGVSLAHVRVAHATTAIAISQGSSHTISHAQIVNCYYGLTLSSAEVRLRNALMANGGTNFNFTSSTARVEHLTVNGSGKLNNTGTLYLTNSLFVAVAATNGWTGVSNVFVASASGVFASVGAGSHYLSSGSGYRDVGSSAIDASLQKDLKTMTTVAPVSLPGPITGATTLNPQAVRDTDTPDLGYHYAPIDYLLSNVTLQAALTLTNGVALGFCGTYGLSMQTGSQVWSEGTPLAMNRMAGPALVQEQPTNLGQAKGMTLAGMYGPTIRLRFTDVSLKGGAKVAVFDPSTYGFVEFSMRDSWLRGCSYSASPNTNSTVISAFTNNIIERSDIQLYHSYGSQNSYHTALVLNNLFLYGNLTVSYDNGTYTPTWKVQDNLFDGTTQSGYGSGYTTYVTVSHDGFVSGTSNSLGGSSHQTGLTRNFQAGHLGPYYYPTSGGGLANLINAGSQANAASASLYHYTSTIDYTREGTSALDIGYHYVATDANGIPVDGDGDGVPDYLEDRNGNGSADSGETNWQSGTDPGLRVLITRPSAAGGVVP